MTTLDLLPFLTARLDEDEAAARANLASTARSRRGGLRSTIWDDEDARDRRVLAEVEAKRHVIALWEELNDPGLYEAVQALAAVYADHPDYDERWRP